MENETVRCDVEELTKALRYWTNLFEEGAERGLPVEELAARCRDLWHEAERVEARMTGKQIYAVDLRYERVLAEDEEAALAEVHDESTPLADRSVELQEDPGAPADPADGST